MSRTTIVVVLAKTDSTAGWREIAGEDRRILSAHAPLATAPCFPVSARLSGLRAGGAADMVTADGLDGSDGAVSDDADDSGLGVLAAALRSLVVDRGRDLRARNLRRVCRGVIDALAEPEQLLLMSLDGTAAEAQSAAEQASLQEHRHVVDHTVDVDRSLLDSLVPEELAVPFDDGIGAAARLDNIREGRTDFGEIWFAAFDPSEAGQGIHQDRRDWLADLVGH